MKHLFKNKFDKISNMTTIQRNTLLCQLSVKEMYNILLPDEIIELQIIQAIRTANGEITQCLKNWEENPELDPRK